MGLIAAFFVPLCDQLADRSAGFILGGGVFALVVLVVVLNVLSQLIFKNQSEPPVVFHWFPFIGSTISYGIDPYKFFFECQRKVRYPLSVKRTLILVNLQLLYSTVTFSHSRYWEGKRRSVWGKKGMNSYLMVN